MMKHKLIPLSAAGIVLAELIGGLSAFAQTTATSTPGAPSTGVGGNALTTALVLVVAALVIAAGMTYLGRKLDASRG